MKSSGRFSSTDFDGVRRRFVRSALTVACGIVALSACETAVLSEPEPEVTDPPAPPPGVATGTIRLEVIGLDELVGSGGTADVGPTGDTPGDQFTLSLPSDGVSQWEAAAGGYQITYTPPEDHALASGEQRSKNLDVTADNTSVITFNVNFDDGGGGEPPPPPPPPPPIDTVPSPPPPPNGVTCESTGSGTCWYVAADGSDLNPGTWDEPLRTPQIAVSSADPGDAIYLRGGTYDLSHAARIRDAALGEIRGIGIGGMENDAVKSGTAHDMLITVKSYPGERAILTDGFTVALSGRSYWRIQDLTIIGGNIAIGGNDAHDIFVTGNDVSGYEALGGTNPGVIRINGGTPPTYNLFIENNVIHDMRYAPCSSGENHCNDPSPDGLAWDEVSDVFHMGGLTSVTCNPVDSGCDTGLIQFKNNVLYNIPQAFFFKREFNGPVNIHDNTIYNVQHLGHWRASNVDFRGNTVYDVVGIGPGGLGPQTSDGGRALSFVGNTFVDWNQIARFGGFADGHTIRDNVIYGLSDTGGDVAYVRNSTGGDLTDFDFDGNCFITTANFFAMNDNGTLYTLDEARNTFGMEGNSVVVAESKNDVFASPGTDDYTLIGAAASQCGGKGASP